MLLPGEEEKLLELGDELEAIFVFNVNALVSRFGTPLQKIGEIVCEENAKKDYHSSYNRGERFFKRERKLYLKDVAKMAWFFKVPVDELLKKPDPDKVEYHVKDFEFSGNKSKMVILNGPGAKANMQITEREKKKRGRKKPKSK